MTEVELGLLFTYRSDLLKPSVCVSCECDEGIPIPGRVQKPSNCGAEGYVSVVTSSAGWI